MVQYFDEIPDFLFTWIAKQKVFWVATAPLANSGLVNLSPKGVDGTFNIVNSHRVWYEDLTGSGIATVAHVRENGRITILFNAFEGPPRLARLYGKGTVYEFGTPEYDALLPPGERHTSSRSIIMIDVFKVSTSCGWGVPFYEYKGQRNRIMRVHSKGEIADIEAETAMDASTSTTLPPRPTNGLKNYWVLKNMISVDGLPGLLTGHESTAVFRRPQTEWDPDDEREFGSSSNPRTFVSEPDLKLVVAFLTGAIVSASFFRFMRSG